MNSEMHVGELIEELIRVNHLSISEVARRMHVNRRSVYNWFKQKTLRPYVFHRICNVLSEDFAIEVPNILQPREKEIPPPVEVHPRLEEKEAGSSSVNYWMNKYIHLLEKYNEILSKGEPRPELSPPFKTPKGPYHR